jgi:hypothetical protein
VSIPISRILEVAVGFFDAKRVAVHGVVDRRGETRRGMTGGATGGGENRDRGDDQESDGRGDRQ